LLRIDTGPRLATTYAALLIAISLALSALVIGWSGEWANAQTEDTATENTATENTATENTATETDDGEKWVGTWGASPLSALGPNNTLGTPARFSDQTIRNIVNTHIGGDTVRVRLSNEFGDRPVTFRSVFIGLVLEPGQPNVDVVDAADDASIVPGSNKQLTFGGRGSVTLQPGQSRDSDPVALRVEAFQDLAISFHVPRPTGPATQHTTAMQVNFVAQGDQSRNISGAGFVPSGATWSFLTDVDVRVGEEAGSVVTLGDSITDGLLSTTNVNNRYPDFLAERLQADERYDNLTVENQGISGNRVLRDNIGPSALNRLNSDVLSQPGITDIIVAEGINDLANPPFIGTPDQNADADDVIAGLKEIARRAHEQGVCVYGGTLTPPGNFRDPARPPFTTYSTPEVNAEREEVNEFIRTSDEFDGFFDFDKAVRDPLNPQALADQFANIDNFHPNDAGYKRIADEVDLTVLAESSSCR